MNNLSTVTPKDIDKLTLKQAFDLCLDEIPGVPSRSGRYNLISEMYKVLGYEMTPDLLMMLVSEVKYMQAMAVAGAGKTTNSLIWSTSKRIWYSHTHKKRLRGEDVLFIVYNDHNVSPIITKHIELIQRLKASHIGGLDLDENITAMTMHKFCLSWMREYPIQTQLPDSEAMSEYESMDLMRTVALDILDFPEEKVDSINFKKLYSAYNLYVGTLNDFTHPELPRRIKESNVNQDDFIMLCKGYSAFKGRKGRIDFSDMLLRVVDLMENYPAARERIQNYYKVHVADEIQDFTPLMIKLYRLIVGDNQTLLVGDVDQTIYDFNGADVRTVLQFPQVFEGGKVFTLNKNRRCSSKVVEAASTVISLNRDRYDTKIIPAREGGEIVFSSYSTEEGQIKSIVKAISSLPPDKQENVAILYRNTAQSSIITNELEKEGIRFNLVSGVKPFEHEIFKHIFSLLNCLANPFVKSHQVHLYKALPFSRLECDAILGYNRKTKSFQSSDKMHFAKIDFGKFENQKKFQESKKVLVRISKAMKTTPLKVYFPFLFKIFRENYWNYKVYKENENRGKLPVEDDNEFFLHEVFNFFMVDSLYSDLHQDYIKRLEIFNRNNERHQGVTVSTFHGVKGREFDETYLTYLDDDIVPSVDRSYSGGEPDLEALLQKKNVMALDIPESETRLFYVAITRARYKVTFSYPVSNPSQYVRILQAYYESKQAMNEAAVSLATSDFFDEVDIEETSAPVLNVAKETTGTGYLEKLFKGL